MSEHSPACGKDRCPNLQPVTVLQAPAWAAEGRPAFSADGVSSSWLFPGHTISQFGACGQASRAPCEGRAQTADSSSPVPAMRSWLPFREGLHFLPLPFPSASCSSRISSLCKDQSAKREKNRSGGRHWEAHLQVWSDSRWQRRCTMADEERVKAVITAACLPALAPSCQHPLDLDLPGTQHILEPPPAKLQTQALQQLLNPSGKMHQCRVRPWPCSTNFFSTAWVWTAPHTLSKVTLFSLPLTTQSVSGSCQAQLLACLHTQPPAWAHRAGREQGQSCTQLPVEGRPWSYLRTGAGRLRVKT